MGERRREKDDGRRQIGQWDVADDDMFMARTYAKLAGGPAYQTLNRSGPNFHFGCDAPTLYMITAGWPEA